VIAASQSRIAALAARTGLPAPAMDDFLQTI
jgi:hypothetical protein